MAKTHEDDSDKSVKVSRRKVIRSISGAAIAAVGASLIPPASAERHAGTSSSGNPDTSDVYRTLALFALFFSASDLMATHDDATLARDFGFSNAQVADIASIRQIAQSTQGGYVRQQLTLLFNKPIAQRPNPVYTGTQCPRDYASLQKVACLSSGC
jgi:hypothetical protein